MCTILENFYMFDIDVIKKLNMSLVIFVTLLVLLSMGCVCQSVYSDWNPIKRFESHSIDICVYFLSYITYQSSLMGLL
jgi:hypothetical protein